MQSEMQDESITRSSLDVALAHSAGNKAITKKDGNEYIVQFDVWRDVYVLWVIDAEGHDIIRGLGEYGLVAVLREHDLESSERYWKSI